MANEEHLRILKQGVEVWNQWRGKNPEVRPDLSGADLSDANLSETDLSGANLIGANLLRNTRHVGDFCQWKHHDAYQTAFQRLLRDLKAG